MRLRLANRLRLLAVQPKHGPGFDSQRSTTFSRGTATIPYDDAIDLRYGTGSATIHAATDTVSVGGDGAQLTATDVPLGVASSVSDDFLQFEADGLCGLAFESLATVSKPTLLT